MIELRLKITNDLVTTVDAFDTRNKLMDVAGLWESDSIRDSAYYHQLMPRVAQSRTLNLRIDSVQGLFLHKLGILLQAKKPLSFIIFGVWEENLWKAGIDMRWSDIQIHRFYGESATITIKPEKTSLDHAQ